MGEMGESRRVLWTQLVTPGMHDLAVLASQRVADRAARLGYHRCLAPCLRTDDARNRAVVALLKMAQGDRDTLVMLDADHTHPPDIVERLVAHDVGVVGALAFRRGDSFDALAFQHDDNGELYTIERDLTGLQEVAVVATCALAIQRWVFKALEEAGYHWPYFRYAYAEGAATQPTEDIWFGAICRAAGIKQYVDCDTVTPHLMMVEVDRDFAVSYAAEHGLSARTKVEGDDICCDTLEVGVSFPESQPAT